MKNPKVRQVVLPLITALIWGSAFVTQSLSAAHLGCFSFNALRAIPAVLVLLVLLAVMQRIHPREKYSAEEKRALLRGGLVCGAFLALAINLQQFGMGTTSAGKAGFITALYIVLVPVFSTVLGKKAKKSIWLCVIAAVAGLYFLCFDGSSTLSFSSGDMYVFLSAFAFTAQILAVDYFVQQVDGIALSCAQFAVVIMLSAIGALAFGEHTTLEAVKTCIPYLLYVGVVSSGVGYTLQIIAQKDGDPTVVSLLLSLESFFAVVCGAIVLHERMSLFHALLMVFGTLLIPYSMCCCITLNEKDGIHGIIYVVMALCGAWLADSGAYFVGTFCGKHKLCPQISPKKTIEGFIGGVVTNGILFIAFAAVYSRIMAARGDIFTVHYVTVCLLGMACALIGTVGDLTASLIKRHFQIKDYGNIMPGHGGLLDRFDSVLLVVPFFCAVLQLTPLYSF